MVIDMIPTNLIFLVKKGEPDQILLGMKKRGFGEGKFNGFGGKVKNDESSELAAVRELYEEASVKIEEKNLIKMAELTFIFTDKSDWDNKMMTYIVYDWEGEAKESEEMKPLWFNVDNLPFDLMWVDDPNWLPKILSGKKIRATFNFTSDGKIIKDFNLEEIENFD